MKKLKEFVNLVEEILKKGNLINLLNDYLDWFKLKLHLVFFKKNKNFIPKKGDIFYVNLGKNIGSELNKIRPCVVYSKRKFNAGGTVIVIPLRSYKGKNKKSFIKISSSEFNNLEKKSLVDIFAIQQVDKKRLLNRVGNLEEKYLSEIDKILIKVLDIKK